MMKSESGSQKSGTQYKQYQIVPSSSFIGGVTSDTDNDLGLSTLFILTVTSSLSVGNHELKFLILPEIKNWLEIRNYSVEIMI